MPTPRRSQAQRSSQTKARLIEAAIECLVDHGYAYTTTVEVCARAGLTRGAYNHHYATNAELLIDVIESLYQRLAGPELDADGDLTLEALIRAGWSRVQHPQFKAVIEIWLASRNDPDLGASLAPAIAQLSGLFEPTVSPRLAALVAANPQLVALYRLAFEAMIGLALGRATSPNGEPVAHEEMVIDLLMTLVKATKDSVSLPDPA